MPQFSISITKRTAFRDSTQEFSNVYTYAGIGTMPNAGQAEVLIDTLVTWEKQVHSSNVTFVKGRLWSSGGTQSQNEMIFEKNLTGVGASSVVAEFDKERAFLVAWKAGKDSRGRVVYLRKWYHTCGQFGTVLAATVAALNNTASLTIAHRDAIAAKADEITRIGATEEWGLIADSGRERDGGLPVAHKYLEHHQLGDQWRS